MRKKLFDLEDYELDRLLEVFKELYPTDRRGGNALKSVFEILIIEGPDTFVDRKKSQNSDLFEKMAAETKMVEVIFDIFTELRAGQSGSERIVQADEVIKRNPYIIIASWCGL